MFDVDGNFLRRLAALGGESSVRGQRGMYLAINGRGDVVVTGYDDNLVRVFSADKHLIDLPISDALGVCFDSFGRLLIGTESGVVVYVS